MPNTRRRRFSTQTNVNDNNKVKFARGSQTSIALMECDYEIRQTKPSIAMKFPKNRSKSSLIGSKKSPCLEILAESDSEVTLANSDHETVSKTDKNVSASSGNIDLINMLNTIKVSEPYDVFKKVVSENNRLEKHVPRSSLRETSQVNSVKRERYPRQHRIKVRSPRRRALGTDDLKSDVSKVNIATTTNSDKDDEPIVIETQKSDTIISNTSPQSTPDNNINNVQNSGIEESSNHSLDEMCRICHGCDGTASEFGPMISACACRGTVGRVHVKCLEHWLTESGKSRCELCGTRYATRRVHRYGVPRALVMWLLSQNAKQLMVDSLGIMLMSPLAVLAAWLSGRTLAGLMVKESEEAPWPLASTFVLACMTLVCYYCWIVSAVTRHALGWWIWYRSQYEVRLETQETDT